MSIKLQPKRRLGKEAEQIKVLKMQIIARQDSEVWETNQIIFLVVIIRKKIAR